MASRLTASVETNPSPNEKAQESPCAEAQATVFRIPSENRVGDPAAMDRGGAHLLCPGAEFRSPDDPRDEPAVGGL